MTHNATNADANATAATNLSADEVLEALDADHSEAMMLLAHVAEHEPAHLHAMGSLGQYDAKPSDVEVTSPEGAVRIWECTREVGAI